MDISNLHENCNYVEFVLKHRNGSKDKNDKDIDISIDNAHMQQILHNLSKRNYKSFSKQFKTYIYNDITMENTDHQEIKVYQLGLVDATESNDFVTMMYSKDKLPFHAFPSTTNHDCIYYTKRLTFRIHHRVFINFDTQYYVDDVENKQINKVFVNYNHEGNMDTELIGSILTSLESLFQTI